MSAKIYIFLFLIKSAFYQYPACSDIFLYRSKVSILLTFDLTYKNRCLKFKKKNCACSLGIHLHFVKIWFWDCGGLRIYLFINIAG